MKNECNIIKDILPLYAEKMVSEDTVDFIEGAGATDEDLLNLYKKYFDMNKE